mmetsp:Transcript_41479/g.61389  ORF Transcript_41479/g.61389 Transcript_41479/m.61389 type:complete len:217 (-) Transcript_41479:456-1106(-)
MISIEHGNKVPLNLVDMDSKAPILLLTITPPCRSNQPLAHDASLSPSLYYSINDHDRLICRIITYLNTQFVLRPVNLARGVDRVFNYVAFVETGDLNCHHRFLSSWDNSALFWFIRKEARGDQCSQYVDSLCCRIQIQQSRRDQEEDDKEPVVTGFEVNPKSFSNRASHGEKIWSISPTRRKLGTRGNLTCCCSNAGTPSTSISTNRKDEAVAKTS